MRTAVFPAYAGMSPARERSAARTRCFPRLRGDEPMLLGAIEDAALFSPPTRG